MSKMRKHWKLIAGVGLLLALTLVIAGCAGPAGPAGAAGTDAAATCSQCHNDTTLIVSKSLQAAQQGHMTGTSYLRASSSSCAGCHSGEGMTAMVAAGIGPNDVEVGVTNPTPATCRTCHQIHTTYTDADWALVDVPPVEMLMSDEIYDSGDGNLCATCHRARRGMDDYDVGVGTEFTVTSSHMGPHHGSEPDMFLGVGAYGISDSVSIHYTLVENGCPTCHVVDGNHTLEPDVDGCTSCHADLDTFDRNGVQTEVEELFAHLGELLEATGLLHDGHPVNEAVGTVAEGGALWNYLYVYEDGSMGIHNPGYTKNMLKSAIAALE